MYDPWDTFISSNLEVIYMPPCYLAMDVLPFNGKSAAYSNQNPLRIINLWQGFSVELEEGEMNVEKIYYMLMDD